MSKSKFNPLITASVMSAVYLAGVSQDAHAVVQEQVSTDSNLYLTETYGTSSNYVLPQANALGQRRYIIQFETPSVARYNGAGREAPIPRLSNHKIDVSSPAVDAYVNMLEAAQTNFLSQLNNNFGRSVEAIASYKFAVNGMALYLSDAEARTVASMSDVKHIELDREYFLDTDAGPTLIGANNVWDGVAPSTGSAFGEGVVLGIIDSGANFDHPPFADVGADGYNHTNPLGAGNYLGVCDPANTEQFDADYTCNDKLIGGYDFVDDVAPGDAFEVLGPEDENGHGTHTASTAGGNLVLTASANGVENIEISGVARHANVIAYDACYTSAQGRGLCPNVSTLGSIDQVIADGIVDVVNYSIGGGQSPWTEAVSQSFLAATDNGVFVSASAGNSGPGPATLGHVEPWTATVGASTHTRGFETLLSATDGPVPPTPDVTDIEYVTSNGPTFGAPIVAGIEYSENIDAANLEACNPFPASSFDGLVALVSRGSCSFEQKINNASDAGAIAVIVHNNAGGGAFGMNTGTTTTVPSVSIPEADGFALRDYINATPPPGPNGVTQAEVTITNPSIINTEQADVMADFSSRGPSPFEVNKPDVTAPGVNILAAFNDNDPLPTTMDEEYGIISGTSMSSPHNAGAAALLRELHPNWTAPEIKSALMMTAVTAGVTKEDGTTPADPFDRGAGRVQVDVASSTGLVMNESAFDFLLANPADGGDPKTLNLPSYKNDNCVGTCSFTREFRSVAGEPVTYSATLADVVGTVSPDSFTVNPGQSVMLDVEIDGASLPAGAVSFGELVLTPQAPVQSFSVNPGGTAIPDGQYDGSLGSMACETVNVSGLASFDEFAVEVALSHTWIGDLVVKLENPDGDVLGLLSRPGQSEGADDGNTANFGDSSNLLSSSPLTYSDSAAVAAETMGDVGGTDAVVCQDNGVCDYSPFPDSVAQPPGTLADMLSGTVNGDWNLCVGDSANFDDGTIDSVSLNFLGQSPVPELHLPLVVTGFPEQPDIDVTPTSLSATLDADTTTDVNLNISNSDTAGADLNWNFGSGNFDLVYAEQADGTGAITNGIVSGFFLQEDNGNGAGAYSADDFVLTQDASITSMVFEGFANGVDLANTATEVTVQIYADAAGLPAGHPEDGLDSFLASLVISNPDASLDLTGNFIAIDVEAANGGPLELPAGTYWVTVFPTQDTVSGDAGRWAWFAAGPDVAGAEAQLISPLLFGGITDWAGLVGLTGEPNFQQLRYNIAGESQCGASWISTSAAGGNVSPGADEDVTVTLDATGLSAGVYTATLCVDSDDPDEPQVLVPVTMTVTGQSDLIFANGFE